MKRSRNAITVFNWILPGFLLLTLFVQANGQGIGRGMGGESKRIEGRAKFMPIPYVNYDRALGFTAGAVPMLMFNPVEKDTLSPSSLIGAVGSYSANKTWFLMGFGLFFLDGDNWRITTAGGIGTVHFQFYLDHPLGGWIPYQSEADFFIFKVDRRSNPHYPREGHFSNAGFHTFPEFFGN
jgi:hypothetical protein